MPKLQSPPSPLNLDASRNDGDASKPLSPSTSSPRSPRSPRSIPGSPFLQDYNVQYTMGHKIAGSEELSAYASQQKNTTNNPGAISPVITAIPQYPPSPPRSSPKHGRDPSKSFFSNLIASKSSHRLQSPDRNDNEGCGRAEAISRASSRDRTLDLVRARGSTLDLPKVPRPEEKTREPSVEGHDSDPSFPPDTIQPLPLSSKKTKPKFGGILSRTRSMKLDDSPKQTSPIHNKPNLDATTSQLIRADSVYAESLKTAPLRFDHRERVLKESIGSTRRNRSADQPKAQVQETLTVSVRKERSGGSIALSNSFKDGTTGTLFSNISQTGKGVGDRIGKAGKGFFGKITKSGSSNARELVSDDNYTCTIITLPLVKQTRVTRIARRLELSKDKTEFWMPALPWRCIDYLNMNGCEEEGLYRIPGSGKDVKHWQRRFDTEHDINLFDEPDLYDINTIGSMFKAWLRDLPDEILPKVVQVRVAEQCMGATKTPQLLKDELSKLPPFNYYLLFAITCHLSLLHSFSDKNKMDYRNLCICFQPCLKIDGFCFQFLVQDWKNCWQGCWTEKEFLEEEYHYERQGAVPPSADCNDDQSMDDGAISSSGSSQHLSDSQTQQAKELSHPRIQRDGSPSGDSRSDVRSGNSTNASEVGKSLNNSSPLGPNGPTDLHPRSGSQLPELGPLSPIKI